MKLEKLNPSIKALTVLLCAILLSFQYLAVLNTAVFLICLLLLIFCSKASLKTALQILIPAFIAALGLFFMGLYYARGSSLTDAELSGLSSLPYAVRAAMSTNLSAALQLATRLLAFAGLGVLFALTTDRELFLYSLVHQCRLPAGFAYGILAAVNLMPGMVREFRTVRLAFRVRGLRPGPFSLGPVFTMLVNSIRWSESVAMAMESKGFSDSSPRTYYLSPRLRWYDWLFCLLSVGAILAGMILLPK